MSFKAGCLFITLLVGTIAFPMNEEDDMSLFFDQSVDPLIVGGEVVTEPVPHMVALTIGFVFKSSFCGGSIINERFVLTAAHCISEINFDDLIMRSLRGILGSIRWSIGGIEQRFDRVIINPNYNDEQFTNDIGFLRTTSNITYNDNVYPIVLNFDHIGADAATITHGWGSTITGGFSARLLRKLRAVTVDGEYCNSEVARVAEILNRNPPTVDPKLEICAFLKPNTGVCHGDSGSALILAENKQQIGVVSWGMPCAQGAPDVFVRVSAYQTWIEQTIQ